MANSEQDKSAYQARKTVIESARSIFYEYERLTELKREFTDLVERDNAASEGGVMLLIGPSGSGKTQLITDFAQAYPVRKRAIVDDQRQEWADDVPVVTVQVPDTNLKSLSETTLRALSGIESARERRADIQDDIKHYAAAMHTRLFIFEEVHQATQHKGSGTVGRVAKFFKDMSNQAKFSLLLVGTEAAAEVVLASDELERRVIATHRLKGFDWNDRADREDFLGILDAMDDRFAKALGRKSDLAGPDVAVRIHRASDGVIGLAARLVERAGLLAVRDMVGTEKCAVAKTHLSRAYQDQQVREDGFNPFTADIQAVMEPPIAPVPPAQGRRGARRAGPDRAFRP